MIVAGVAVAAAAVALYSISFPLFHVLFEINLIHQLNYSTLQSSVYQFVLDNVET